MVGWHHQLNGHEFEPTPGDSEGQGNLECYSPWQAGVTKSWTWLRDWISTNPLVTGWPNQPKAAQVRILRGKMSICSLNPHMPTPKLPGHQGEAWSESLGHWISLPPTSDTPHCLLSCRESEQLTAQVHACLQPQQTKESFPGHFHTYFFLWHLKCSYHSKEYNISSLQNCFPLWISACIYVMYPQRYIIPNKELSAERGYYLAKELKPHAFAAEMMVWRTVGKLLQSQGNCNVCATKLVLFCYSVSMAKLTFRKQDRNLKDSLGWPVFSFS